MSAIKIKMLVLDVDGTLTDASIYYGDNNLEIKAFNAKDGMTILAFIRLGVDVIFLTGRRSEAVERRAKALGATAIQGCMDKLPRLRELLLGHGIKPEECAYIGDDINDYAAMKICGFKGCPADAAIEIRGICDYVSSVKGGHGAVRDICEYILKQNGKYVDFLKFWGVE